MPVFLIDEDLPRSTRREIIKLGYQALDVRDVGLKGKSDDEIFLYAQKHNAILISADLDFANIIRFSVGAHNGIIILRFPNEISNETMNRELITVLDKLKEDIHGRLIIIEPNRARIHKVA